MKAVQPHDDLGNGPEAPLLLVHAFPFDGRMWRHQAASQSKTRRVIIPDLRGFGRARDLEPPTSLVDHADDLAELIDYLGVPKVVFAGLSMGGYIALAFAKKYADKLAGLVLCDTRAAPDSAEGKAGRDKSIDLVKTSGAAALMEGLVPKLFAVSTPDAVKEEARKLGADQPVAGIAAALAAMRDRPDRTGELASIQCPALVITGEEDKIATVAESKTIAEALPNARFVMIPGAGHLSNLEAPDAFDAAISAV